MRYALSLWLILISCAVYADEPDSPGLHYFVVPSPSNTCFAVHSVVPWQAGPDITKFGRIQLFRSDTGVELWRIDGILCYQNDLFPADDLKHIAVVRSYFRSWDNDSIPVVCFYSEGKRLSSYTLKELGFDVSKLKTSVSHASFVTVERPELAWSWEWPLGSDNARNNLLVTEPNPRWEDSVFIVKALDGRVFRFEDSSGKLLPFARTP